MSEEFEIVKLEARPNIKRRYRGPKSVSLMIIENFVAKEIKWGAVKVPRGRRAGYLARGLSRALHRPKFKDKVRVLGHDNAKGEVYLENTDL